MTGKVLLVSSVQRVKNPEIQTNDIKREFSTLDIQIANMIHSTDRGYDYAELRP